MPAILQDYLPIVVFMGLSLFITLLLILPPLLIAPKNPDSEKLSPYECGFDPFDDARSKFDIRFYLVAILFIIFVSICFTCLTETDSGCFAMSSRIPR